MQDITFERKREICVLFGGGQLFSWLMVAFFLSLLGWLSI